MNSALSRVLSVTLLGLNASYPTLPFLRVILILRTLLLSSPWLLSVWHFPLPIRY